jgi:prefoldin subunit 5
MDRTLRDHLEWLQGKVETLNNQIMECASREQANHLQSEIRAIELAISHYEAALKVENRIASSAPSS